MFRSSKNHAFLELLNGGFDLLHFNKLSPESHGFVFNPGHGGQFSL